MDNKLTHFDNSGNARMVDVSEKNETARVAVAVSKIKVSRETLELIENGKIGKGDVLGLSSIMRSWPPLTRTARRCPPMLRRKLKFL